MGLACQIIKKNSKIDKVEAPNGERSILFENAKRILGDEKRALEVWAKAYTPEFLSYYGNWMYPVRGEVFNTDLNGEPILDDVLAYMERQSYEVGILTKNDVRDVRSALASTGLNDVNALRDVIVGNFNLGGDIVVNRQNMIQSGLYTEEEISRIESDQDARNRMMYTMRKIISYVNSYYNKDKDAHFFSGSAKSGPVVVRKGVFDQLGKQQTYNSAELYEALKNEVGGVEDRQEFESRMENLRSSYPELVERFLSDKEFAEDLYDEFRSMSSIPVMEVENGQVVPGKNRRQKLIERFFHYNSSKVQELRTAVSDFLGRDPAESEAETVKKLRAIEEAATFFGIDIIGLSDAYSKTGTVSPEIENVVLDLDIFVSREGDVNYIPTLSSSIDKVLGDSTPRYVQTLPPSMRDLSIVHVDTDLSDREMFENHSLLKVGAGLYQQVNRDTNIGALYDAASVLAKSNSSYFPASIYPASCFKNGVLDSGRIKQTDVSDIKNGIQSYVRSETDSQNTEEMVMTRIAFKLPAKVAMEKVDTAREYDRYMNKPADDMGSASVYDLYRGYLSNKLHGTELYNNVYKYLDFSGRDWVRAISADPEILRSIELGVDGKLRSNLFDLSMVSSDPTMFNLFYLDKSNPIYAGDDFKHYLYTRNPGLLRETRAESKQRGEALVLNNTYDEYLKSDGEVLTKVGETQDGGVYAKIEGSEADVKYRTKQQSWGQEISREENGKVGIRQDFNISDEEKNKLGRLEC